ncbi:Fic family protein [Thiotrichales bacterium 19X7-9]|nr:Fic family protein [Thiotrichales bacterium 19X7-9]
MDIFLDKDLTEKVETQRSGIFKFQLGIDDDFEFKLLYQRVLDTQSRFKSSPLSSLAKKLEREVIVSSVFGTNHIEGGKLTEDETDHALRLDPKQIQDIEQQRAVNIKKAYDYIKKQAKVDGWKITYENILEVHKLIGYKLEKSEYQPGVLRDNSKQIITRVGSKNHGGLYKPPQFGKDIHTLLKTLLDWHSKLIQAEVPALIRAPLMHLYFELIHPFWDGNGRVGRVIEAGILYAEEGFQYAPFAQARYYSDNIHEYFALFNVVRKSSDKKEQFPNSDFIMFFLKGMLEVINKLHDRVNDFIDLLLVEASLIHLKNDKKLNDRQYSVMMLIRRNPGIKVSEMKKMTDYNAWYKKLTDKTKSRDLKKLYELGLLVEKEGKVFPRSMKL